jgi:Bardet-Biedl syndrome 1 protein
VNVSILSRELLAFEDVQEQMHYFTLH